MQQSVAKLRGAFRLWLAVAAFLVPSTGNAHGPSSSDEVPEGLSAGDWSSIRQAYEAGRHAAYPVEDGYRASNPGQEWQTRFDRRGFTIRPDAGGWTWGLELERYGFAGQERALASPERVNAEGQRVTYDWDSTLQEWYVNDARGLEHGYTVHQRPPQDKEEGPLTLTLAVRGELAPEVQDDGRGVRFVNEGGAAVLTYAGLTVFETPARPTYSCAAEPAGANRPISRPPTPGASPSTPVAPTPY